ncbi:MAG TPA: cation diffusion facilitator family transporter [Caldimonas sp.]|nr:cation diffusion facilitator family transporter [Caldimonas sp.]HEX4234551.1 cation diffusion facilitator family transporter [Caldimonas sp.]
MQVTTLLRLSVATAVVTIVLKTTAWWITGSVGLLSDAMESLVNLASALFALAMVTIAARPADEDHPFGHTKAEYFSSAFEGLMIAAAAIAIVWSAIGRFMRPQPLEGVGIGLTLTVASSLLNGLLAAKMLAESRRHRSVALEADARHLYTDVWTSAGVVVGILLVQLTGWLWLDPVVAIGVAVNIIREGARVVWGSIDGLMDKALEPEVQARIDETLARFAESSVRFDDMVTRRAGSRRFLDMHMHVPASWTLGRAAALRGEVEQALMSEVAGLRASIQLLPSNVEPHFNAVQGSR